jgi:hypothetical protein
LEGCHFWAVIEVTERTLHDVGAEFPNSKLVRETPNRCEEAQEPVDGMTPRICETVKTFLVSDQSTRIEGAKAKGIIVKYPSGFRVGCQQDLEAAVKQKSFSLVRSNPSPDPVRGFQDLRRNSTLMELKRTTETRQPSTNDNNVRVSTHDFFLLNRSIWKIIDRPFGDCQVEIRKSTGDRGWIFGDRHNWINLSWE